MGYIRHTRLGTRAHTRAQPRHVYHPCLFTPTSGAQPAPARRAHAPTRQGGAARGKFCFAGATARYTLAAWGCAFSALGCATRSVRALKPPRAQGPGVEGCGAAARSDRGRPIFHGVPRARRRMYWVIRRSRNASRRAQPPYTAASRLQTRCTCEATQKAVSSVSTT